MSNSNSITSKPRRFSIGKRRTYAGWSFRYPSGQQFKTLARGFDQYGPNTVHAVKKVPGGVIELPLHSEGDGWAYYEPPSVKIKAEVRDGRGGEPETASTSSDMADMRQGQAEVEADHQAEGEAKGGDDPIGIDY